MAFISSLSWTAATAVLLFYVVSYSIVVVVYRLWFSPIAKFPGPFLARVTFWYGFYFEYVQLGTYYLKIKEMHEKYGPVVRVTPEELHVSEPMFYHQLFVPGAVRKTNNYPRSGEGTGFEDMTAVSQYHDIHRAARVPLDPFFSKAGVSRVEPRVLQRIQKLCRRIRAEQGTGKVINITYALSSVTTDVISSVIFEEPSDYLEDSEFNASWYNNLKRGTISVPLFAHLPWLAKLVTSPLLKYVIEYGTKWRIWDDKAKRQILSTKLRPSDEAKTREDTTVFDHLVHSDLVEAQFGRGGFSRLAQLIQQAGAHNVSHTLVTIMTYLLLDDMKLNILRAELSTVFENSKNMSPSMRDLEKAPYLSACIKEGLRMAIGGMNRTARVSPDVELEVGGWVIPKGVPVSMSSYWMHNDPKIFPDPFTFKPERWFCGPEELKVMNNYYVPFAKGSRNCLGQNLVHVQIYHTLAQMFRPGAPELMLYESDASDVIAVHGLLFPMPKLSSKGVRATVH